MAETILNPALLAPETVRNGDILHILEPEAPVTLVNPRLTEFIKAREGEVLCGAWHILSPLPERSGEADLYLCEKDGVYYAAKVYRRPQAVKDAVAQKLQGIETPCVARPCAWGEWRGAPVEILPYYPEGSLQGRTFPLETLKDTIIPCLIEGLHALHEADIIHKDLKPANIMLREGGGVAIIDFGISSVAEKGQSILLTQTGMTPEYAAPESLKGLYLKESDYYSLGVTVYELFHGSTPFHGLSAEDVSRHLAAQKLPLPRNMPAELCDLIKGLTYVDVSNRADPDNPHRRWGYQEVQRWLRGVIQPIPGEGLGKKEPFPFMGREYVHMKELVRALAENWKEGSRQLFRGQLSAYFQPHDSRAYRICQEAELASRRNARDDVLYWQALTALNSDSAEFCWKGQSWANTAALGRALTEQLEAGSKAMNAPMREILAYGLLSRYVEMKRPDQPGAADAMRALETAWQSAGDKRDRDVLLYVAGYTLSGQMALRIAGGEFRSVGELTAHMRAILGPGSAHLDELRAFCHALMPGHERLAPAFEGWLIALGQGDAVAQWKRLMTPPART